MSSLLSTLICELSSWWKFFASPNGIHLVLRSNNALSFHASTKERENPLCQTSINGGKVLNDHCVYFMTVLDISLHSLKTLEVEAAMKNASLKSIFVRRQVSKNTTNFVKRHTLSQGVVVLTLFTSFNYSIIGGGPIWLYTYQMSFFTIRNKLNSFKRIALAWYVYNQMGPQPIME